MLCAFFAFVCVYTTGPIPWQEIVFLTMQSHFESPQFLPRGITKGQGDIFSRRAERAAYEAARLRQKQTEKDLNAAIAFFQKSAGLFRAAHLNSKAADAKLQIGDIYFTLSQFRSALASYQEARDLSNKNTELLCLVLGHMARTYATVGQQSNADKSSKQALRHCNALSDLRIQAEVLDARGEVLYNSGKSVESVGFFSRAKELFEQANDMSGLAHSLLMLAYAHFRDERVEALQFAGKALQLSHSIGDPRGVAEAQTALGIFASMTDDFETARCNYEQSLPVFQRIGDRDNEAITLNGIGYARKRTGDLEESLENFTRAKALFLSIHDQLGAGEAITGISKAMGAMRQYRLLLPIYRIKLRVARQTHNIGQEASVLADLAAVYEQQHQYGKAKALYQHSLDAYVAAKRDYGAGDILVRLALLHERQGQHLEALALLEQARDLKAKTGEVEDVASIHYELANIYRHLNRLQDARTTIEKSISIIESQRFKIAKFDSRAAYFSWVHKYYALYIQILMSLKQQDSKRSLAQLAFETSEKSKVRALLDLLNAAKEESGCDELLQRQLAPLNSRESHTRTEQANVTSPVLTLEEIQAEIGSDNALLEYVLSDEKSYVWLIDRDHIIAYELPPAQKIGKLVKVFHDVLTAREPREGEDLDEHKKRVRKADHAYPQIARQLSRMLLGPIDLVGVKRLLIVPDGSLQYVPFAALSLPQSGEENIPLMANHEVVILPSATALASLRKAAEKRAPPTRTAIIVADPVFDDDDPRLPKTRISDKKKPQKPLDSFMRRALRDAHAPQYVTRLQGAGAEADAIWQILDSPDVLVERSFDANRSFILQGALESYRIVHFATHGIIDARRPEMSGLILSLIDETAQPQDGYLRLGDIYKLKLSADLVVLSACSSALGKDMESEGIIGLPRGFLYAGAKSVIASLWKVDDEAAVVFMRNLYMRIRKGESASSALRDAQLDMSREKRWREPFYWAGFVLQGDYK